MKKIIFVFFLNIAICINIYAESGIGLLSGKIDYLHNGDSVILLESKYEGGIFPLRKEHICIVSNKSFKFKIPLRNSPVFFELILGHSNWRMSGGYFLNAEDDVFLDKAEVSGYLHFSGKGSTKLNIIYQLSKIEDHYRNGYPRVDSEVINYFQDQDASTIHRLKYLSSKTQEISKNDYQIIRSDILADAITKYTSIGGRGAPIQKVDDIRKSLNTLKDYKDNLAKFYLSLYHSPNKVLQFTKFSKSIKGKYMFDSCIVADRPFKIQNYYSYIKSNFKGTMRDRLVTDVIYYYKDYTNMNLGFYLNDALTFVRNEDFIPILQNLKKYRIRGSIAYNFALPDINDSIHQLSDFKGKVVFVDFYTKNCGNCIEIAPYLAKLEKSFSNQQVVFISINCDLKKDDWLYCLKSGKYSSSEILNLSTYGKPKQNPILINYAINSYPTLMLVDKRGMLMKNPTDPRSDNGKDLIDQITYALYEN